MTYTVYTVLGAKKTLHIFNVDRPDHNKDSAKKNQKTFYIFLALSLHDFLKTFKIWQDSGEGLASE